MSRTAAFSFVHIGNAIIFGTPRVNRAVFKRNDPAKTVTMTMQTTADVSPPFQSFEAKLKLPEK